MTYELRPYQQECVAKGLDVFKRKAREIIVAPTGVGKSIIIAEIAKKLKEEEETKSSAKSYYG
jgi:superfamily II DNA or RNA helicase